MKKALMRALVLLLVMQASYALELYDSECFNNGRIEFTLSGNNQSKAYTKDIMIKYHETIIEGSWDSNYIAKSDILSRKYGTFISKEGALKNKDKYAIDIFYVLVENATAKYEQKLSFSADCPGLLFSCSLLNLSIENCYTQDNKFNAIINASGLAQSEPATMKPDEVIIFKIKAENSYLDINNVNSKEGNLPMDYKINDLKDGQYLLEFDFENNNVNSLYAGFNDKLFKSCSQNDYTDVKFYDLKTCSVKEGSVQQPKVEDQKAIEPAAENKTEAAENKTEAATSAEEISPKKMIMLAVIVIVIGVIAIFLLKKRDIKS